MKIADLVTAAPRRTVAILGGGLSGAAVAWHLARTVAPAGVAVVVVEPRVSLGAGLAYGTPDPAHRLNVPHTKMALDPDDPDDFRRWLAGPQAPALDHAALLPDGRIFPPRAVFGSYVAARLAPALQDGRLRHLRARALRVEAAGQGHRIGLDDGTVLDADAVVLAISHPAPAVPPEYAALAGDPRLVPDAFAPGALDAIAPGARVMVLGSGLTAADVVASLHDRGHHGPVVVSSRNGRLSQGHGPTQAETAADYSLAPPQTALALLRRVRRDLAADAALGLTWHALFDRLRAQGPLIWSALPMAERRRLLRHLRGLWDVHRFRIAPQTAAIMARLTAAGQVSQVAGRAVAVVPAAAGIDVSLRKRHGRGTATLTVDHVILATGPAHSRVTETNPLLRQMHAAGMIRPDALRLGLDTAPTGEALGADGAPQPTLFVAGPLARGTVGELMGVPEVTGWAKTIAARVAETVVPPEPGLLLRVTLCG